MTKKILAIHNNSLFFGADTPNFYQWLADQRGVGEEMQEIQAEYSAKKKSVPLLLREAYKLAMDGLTKKELNAYIVQFFVSSLFISCALSRTTHLIEKISEEHEVYVFTSYPVEVFKHPQYQKKFFHIIGPRANYENCKINSWRIYNEPFFEGFDHFIHGNPTIDFAVKCGILKRNKPCYFLNEHLLTPDRYGLVLKLIDIMLEQNISTNNLIILGSGVTAEPMHKIGGRRVEKLEELL